jgi:hypothetical protein
MPIEQFTREEFEAALPKHRDTGKPLWTCLGPIEGEFAYLMQTANPDVFILIRSSVRPSGVAAGCGEDSIRCWLVGSDKRPLGSKLQKYTTRVPGWSERLVKQLRALYALAGKITRCGCGQLRRVFKAGTAENSGRFFSKCGVQDCKKSGFVWLTDKEGNMI